MRLVIVTVVALICWGQAAPLGAVEAVRLPVSCSYAANKVVLIPSPSEELLVIVGDREHKSVRACAPGVTAKCRNLEVYRFDLLCGGKPVSWRLIAGQLLNLASAPAMKRDPPLRTHLEPWEVRLLLADSEFAPVDEFGARILSVADKPPPRSAGRDTVAAKTVAATETAPPSEAASKFESDAVRAEPAKAADEPSLVQPVLSLQSPPAASVQQPGMPPTDSEPRATGEGAAPATPAEKAESKPAAAVTRAQADGVKRGEANPASDAAAAADTPPPGKPARPSWYGLADLFLAAFACALLLIVVVLAALTAIAWRKSASSRPYAPYLWTGPPPSEAEADEEPDENAEAVAEACRELMKQVTSDLVNAMGAVNSLKGAPALQTALSTELDSIRRSLGFTQTRGIAREKKDWNQIKQQLILSLQGTQRIIGIAEAARSSFSHPAALEVITTRLEAYAFLGVNASSSEAVLKKAVNALRQCWHPDLATDEEDRRLREIRIKQINVAWDLISRKQMSAC